MYLVVPANENCRAYDVVDPAPWMNQTGQSMSTDLQRDRREPSIRNLKRLLEVVVNGTLKEQITFAFGREYERSTSTVGCSWVKDQTGLLARYKQVVLLLVWRDV